MRVALSLAALFCWVACSSEARKLGEVDVGGSDTGSGGGYDSGGTPSGSGGNASGGGDEASGGVPITIGSGGGGSSVGMGGQMVLDGGAIVITDEQRAALLATACSGALVEGEQIPQHVELVVDTSASMAEPVFGANGLSKWQVTRDALLDAVVGVNGPGLAASVQAGLFLYPRAPSSSEDLDCTDSRDRILPALLGPAGSEHRTRLGQSLLAVVPKGISPTLEAYASILNEETWSHAVSGARFALLVTDGAATAPDCADPSVELLSVDPQPIVEEIAAANVQYGVRTFVVGTPGSEANRQWLSAAALQGGTAPPGCSVESGDCHIDLTVNPDLSAALNDKLRATTGSVISCMFDFPVSSGGNSVDPDLVHVVLTSSGQSQLLLRANVANCSTGWQVVDGRIQLCSESCAAARQGTVEIWSDCPPIR